VHDKVVVVGAAVVLFSAIVYAHLEMYENVVATASGTLNHYYKSAEHGKSMMMQ